MGISGITPGTPAASLTFTLASLDLATGQETVLAQSDQIIDFLALSNDGRWALFVKTLPAQPSGDAFIADTVTGESIPAHQRCGR
jgi:hypothetical protein